jgi:hypothetical protein
LMVTSILTTVPYAIALRFLYPSLGIGLGTILSYLSALPGACVAYTLSSRSVEEEENPRERAERTRCPQSDGTPESPAQGAVCRLSSIDFAHSEGASSDCRQVGAACGHPVYFRYTIG